MKTHKATIRGREVSVTVPGEEPGTAPDTIVDMRTFVAEAIEAYCEASNVNLEDLRERGLGVSFTVNGVPWHVEISQRAA